MNDNYDRSFELVIGHEGGFQRDPNDRGNWTTGRIGSGQNKGTKYGITAMSYPHLDIGNITVADAKRIYKKDYWDVCHCDELPSGLDHLTFDAAVNHGTKRAMKFLQLAVGSRADGAYGPNTRASVQRADPEKAITEFCAQRMLFYTGISTFSRYGKGWTRRAFRTHWEAKEMRAGPLDQSKPTPTEEPKTVRVQTDGDSWWESLGFRRLNGHN